MQPATRYQEALSRLRCDCWLWRRSRVCSLPFAMMGPAFPMATYLIFLGRSFGSRVRAIAILVERGWGSLSHIEPFSSTAEPSLRATDCQRGLRSTYKCHRANVREAPSLLVQQAETSDL